MDTKFGGKTNMYGPVVSDMKALGKRTLEWDLNDWTWDGDRFLACQLNPAPSDCQSRQLFPLGPEIESNGNVSNSSSPCSEEINLTIVKGNNELDMGRRFVAVPDKELNDAAGPLNLKLGEQVYSIAEGNVDTCEGKNVKKKLAGTTSNHPVCQVDDCRANLSNAKDYHRRHKVCEMHSKAFKALVGNAMQRFCQQCSRFHVLQEFDEGKKSCRRRLAGHNKRRRKTNPETSVNAGSLNDEKSTGHLVLSLLKILSNLHTSGSDQSKNQDLLSHLLGNLAAPLNGSNISELMQGSQGLSNAGTSSGIPEKDSSRTQEQCPAIPSSELQKGLPTQESHDVMQHVEPAAQARFLHPTSVSMPLAESTKETNVERFMVNNIDLNNVYHESEDSIGDQANGHSSVPCPFLAEHDVQKSSPPHASGNSESTSGRSCSSGSDTESRTDRIVLKLFGKDPNDLPLLLRTQILDWLSRKPTDIEGYIRPGCIVLTIYLRLNKSFWEELSCDMSSNLSRLLNVSNDPFWKAGWIYTRVPHRAAFICDGRVVLDTPLPFKNHRSRIISISPLAVPAAETVQLVVRGSNITQSTSRLLCAIEGRYLVEESCCGLVEDANAASEQDDIESLSFHCSIPDVIGRGFIEVEDYGLTGCFFPFIVAEPEICSEICMLEKVMEVLNPDDDIDEECSEIDARNQAVDFIHEMGWLLHKNRSSSKQGHSNPYLDLFPFQRLKWLVEFSVDHDWCAVLRKLLDLLFSGIVDPGEYSSIEQALSEIGLLHVAVRRNNRPMVELLLRYIPKNVKSTSEKEQKLPFYEPSSFVFRPDTAAGGGLTPLHIAASTEGSENVLDALLEDPGNVGIEAWKNARDNTGLTPSDYASLRGHYPYINLVQRKINEKSSGRHVVVDIPSPSDSKANQKQTSERKSVKVDSFYTEKFQSHPSCKLCLLKPDYIYGYRGAAVSWRPAMLSLVAIAAVCVCAALLFKSSPQIKCVFGVFNWESLKYGPM